MATNINDIVNSFNTDLARPNRFDVIIVPPPALQNNITESAVDNFGNVTAARPTNVYTDLLAYRCEIAQLPGRNLSTVEQKIYGPSEKFPHHVTYNDIDMTFIVDGDMREKYFFDAWLDYINPTNSFNIAYKETYCTDIKVIQYDISNRKSYSVTLVDAYPISVNQLDLDWSNDGVHKLSVTFAYTYWYNDSQSPSNPININTDSNWDVSGESAIIGIPGF
jgi:hypothetical protein